MPLTEHGISTTTERDCFREERYWSCASKSCRYQWDYRDANGELHSGVARTHEAAVKAAKLFGYKGE